MELVQRIAAPALLLKGRVLGVSPCIAEPHARRGPHTQGGGRALGNLEARADCSSVAAVDQIRGLDREAVRRRCQGRSEGVARNRHVVEEYHSAVLVDIPGRHTWAQLVLVVRMAMLV